MRKVRNYETKSIATALNRKKYELKAKLKISTKTSQSKSIIIGKE